MGKKRNQQPARPQRRYEVELSLPDTDLSGNKSVHYFAKNEAFQTYKRAADLQFRMAQIPRFDGPEPLRFPVRLTAHFYNYRGHPYAKRFYMPRDMDNGIRSLKAVQDALKTAHIVPDDGIKFVKWADMEFFTKKEEHNRKIGVTFIIEEAP